MSEELKVGSTVWRHVDRYHKPLDYKVESEFVPLVITGETRVSWVAKEGWMEFKFPKKKDEGDWNKDPDTRLGKNRRGDPDHVYLTRRAVDDEVWISKNARRLQRHFEGLLGGGRDARRARELARLTGYVEVP